MDEQALQRIVTPSQTVVLLIHLIIVANLFKKIY